MPDTRSVVRPVVLAFALMALWQGGQALAQGLEEVIVTAQKREQGLQDVPVAVEAFSRDQIDNLAARDISDLSVFTPNVTVTKAANQPNYFIRGIGTRDFGVGRTRQWVSTRTVFISAVRGVPRWRSTTWSGWRS